MWQAVILILLGALALIYLYSWKKFQYFSKHGIPEQPGYFPLGSDCSWKLLTRKVSFFTMFEDLYINFKSQKLVGYYGFLGMQKAVVITDMELVKDVLIRDFDHFVDRRDMKVDMGKYMNNLLTVLKGDKWRSMRHSVSPIFTSGKLKATVGHIHKVAQNMQKFLDEEISKGNTEHDAKELFRHYGTEVIATLGFGIDVESFKDPNGVFNDNLDRIGKSGKHLRTKLEMAKMVIFFLFPKLASLMKFKFFDEKGVKFFTSIIKRQLDERDWKPSGRGDFIDTLLQTLSNSDFTREDAEVYIISNVFILFFAGFDTTSTGNGLTAWNLARNPECQQKAYEEIKEAVEANGGNEELDYNSVQNLEYLESCINESLREIALLERECTKDYPIKGTNIVIPKGTVVQIPATDMMKDKEFFDHTDGFNPENFSQEANAEKGPYRFMSFGHGPRNCVGKRFAIIQMKIGLSRLLLNYKLSTCSKTPEKVNIDLLSSAVPFKDLWIKIEKRQLN